MNRSLNERLRAIQALVLDVDGVLTDGRIVYSDAGHELQAFHCRDGSGLALWRRLGHQVAIISGRGSAALSRRTTELGIAPVVMRATNKVAALMGVLTEMNVTADAVAAIGDDLPDLGIFARVGVRIAVADACAELREVADLVTTAAGGSGAVREAIEVILKAQGRWTDAVAGYR